MSSQPSQELPAPIDYLSPPIEQVGHEDTGTTTTTTSPTNILQYRDDRFPPISNPQIAGAWTDLINHINSWYYDIDVDCLRIALAAVVGHRMKNEVPTWLFVLGASGTGKSIIPELISPLKDSHRINSITANTLLSGLPKAKGGTSLLLEIGDKNDHSGILVFPDFTTTISAKEDALKKIAGDLREVYDGRLRKDTGTGKAIEWTGKVTIVAMCTPELERLWGPMRGLGERFVQVRWARNDGIKQATKAYTQIGLEKSIKKKMGELSKVLLCDNPIFFPDVLDPLENGVAHIAEITSLLRTGAIRDVRSKKLEDVGEPEGNTRFFKAIVQIARAHAALFRRQMVREDYQLAARVAIDSIPQTRLQVIRAIPDFAPSFTQQELIASCSNKPKTTILRSLEDLEYLGAVTVNREEKENYIELSSKFKLLREGAGSLWH
jgi:hypothetical protein